AARRARARVAPRALDRGLLAGDVRLRRRAGPRAARLRGQARARGRPPRALRPGARVPRAPCALRRHAAVPAHAVVHARPGRARAPLLRDGAPPGRGADPRRARRRLGTVRRRRARSARPRGGPCAGAPPRHRLAGARLPVPGRAPPRPRGRGARAGALGEAHTPERAARLSAARRGAPLVPPPRARDRRDHARARRLPARQLPRRARRERPALDRHPRLGARPPGRPARGRRLVRVAALACRDAVRLGAPPARGVRRALGGRLGPRGRRRAALLLRGARLRQDDRHHAERPRRLPERAPDRAAAALGREAAAARIAEALAAAPAGPPAERAAALRAALVAALEAIDGLPEELAAPARAAIAEHLAAQTMRDLAVLKPSLL